MSTKSTIAIVSGSHRINSQSRKVADFIRTSLTETHQSDSTIIDLAESDVPLWDEGVWQNAPRWVSVWDGISKALDRCAGLVIVTPEWGGMVPPALKNFLLLSSRELSHKPALIVSISSGEGGAYPVAELRSFGYKNNRVCYIPDHVILRHVSDLLNDATASADSDIRARARIEYSLRVLLGYSVALEQVRASGLIDLSRYPYGM
jgi:NAD(P)H-dependent FMN reductase